MNEESDEIERDDSENEVQYWQSAQKIAADPSNDLELRRDAAREFADFLSDCLSELPYHVLFDSKIASAQDCRQLMIEVLEFEKIADGLEMLEAYAELIKRCRLHFTQYRKFLESDGSSNNYVTFLENDSN